MKRVGEEEWHAGGMLTLLMAREERGRREGGRGREREGGGDVCLGEREGGGEGESVGEEGKQGG